MDKHDLQREPEVSSGFFYWARITHIMSASPPVVRGGEYAARGDYHREPDPSWDYYPTYLAKLCGRARVARSAAGIDARARRRMR